MRRTIAAAAIAALGAFGMSVGVPAQEARPAQQAEQGRQEKQDKRDTQGKQGEVVTVEGCLTSGQQNGFILTADPGELASGVAATTGGAVRTVTYQLVVRDPSDLQKLIGKRVEVRGRADEDPRATTGVHREKETAAKPHEEGVTPKVETTEKAKIEVKKLTVVSFKPLGGECLTGK